MAERFPSLNPKLRDFIARQHIYFVATAAQEGRVNVSPKGMDSLRILDDNTLIWLNVTGSGNETAAHLLDNPRMTLMFCSYDRQPLILRLYGTAEVCHKDAPGWAELSPHFADYTGARQIFTLTVDLVQTSCGYAVPFYDYTGERETLNKWADKKGKEGIEQYWQQKNTLSLDGKPTGIDPVSD